MQGKENRYLKIWRKVAKKMLLSHPGGEIRHTPWNRISLRSTRLALCKTPQSLEKEENIEWFRMLLPGSEPPECHRQDNMKSNPNCHFDDNIPNDYSEELVVLLSSYRRRQLPSPTTSSPKESGKKKASNTFHLIFLTIVDLWHKYLSRLNLLTGYHQLYLIYMCNMCSPLLWNMWQVKKSI